MACRIYAHWFFIRVYSGDGFIHIEEIAILVLDCFLSLFLNGIPEIKIDSQTGLTHTKTCIATFLSSPGGNITRYEVTEGRVSSFKKIISFFFRNFI